MNVSGHVYIVSMSVWCRRKPQKGARSPGTGAAVIDKCELSCGCWHPNPDPLLEQAVLLTVCPAPLSTFNKEILIVLMMREIYI